MVAILSALSSPAASCTTFRLHGPSHQCRLMHDCTYSFRPPPPPPAPPRGLSPICSPSCLQRSNFSSAPGLLRLAHSKRAGPGGYCIQFCALALDAMINSAIVVSIRRNISAPFELWPFRLHSVLIAHHNPAKAPRPLNNTPHSDSRSAPHNSGMKPAIVDATKTAIHVRIGLRPLSSLKAVEPHGRE